MSHGLTGKPIRMTEKQESEKPVKKLFSSSTNLVSPLVPVWRNHKITKHEWNVQYFSKEKSLFDFLIILPSWVFRVSCFSCFSFPKTEALFSRNLPHEKPNAVVLLFFDDIKVRRKTLLRENRKTDLVDLRILRHKNRLDKKIFTESLSAIRRPTIYGTQDFRLSGAVSSMDNAVVEETPSERPGWASLPNHNLTAVCRSSDPPKELRVHQYHRQHRQWGAAAATVPT